MAAEFSKLDPVPYPLSEQLVPLNVLVVGSGSREHALTWRLKRSSHVSGLWVAGGNSGTAQLAANVPISPEDVAAVVALARDIPADLVVVGPEQPLADGLVDELASLGIPAFGPSREAARLEASKSFARQVMRDAGVPGPDYRVFADQSAALDFLRANAGPVVVKADGLAAGKGVALCADTESAVIAVKGCMADGIFGPAGRTVVIEEWLHGAEVSVFAFSDGIHLSPLVAACDYKQIGEGDTGPNTGGMGSFTPPAFWNSDVADMVSRTIIEPTIEAMADMGCPYRGMLYAGLMFTREGPRVLEFNCRFGDPEAQVILPLLASDPVEVMKACIESNLATTPVEWASQTHVGVVMASEGYPGPYDTGKVISGLEDCGDPKESAKGQWESLVFHAGTRDARDAQGNSQVVTNGGRVLTVVGKGTTLEEARHAAYRRVNTIQFENACFRQDIGDLSVGNRIGV